MVDNPGAAPRSGALFFAARRVKAAPPSYLAFASRASIASACSNCLKARS